MSFTDKIITKFGHNTSDKSFDNHFHIQYEIIFATKGEALFTINEKEHLVKENSIVFINSFEQHKFAL